MERTDFIKQYVATRVATSMALNENRDIEALTENAYKEAVKVWNQLFNN